MREELISERLVPVLDSVDSRRVVIGAPLLPTRFIWRRESYTIAEVLEEWRETGPCHHGSGERYVRKHWFRVRMATGEEMKIYFERQARSPRELKRRWWLYTVTR
jgi:phosphoribosylglycinamide formyltransferase-1